MIAVHRRLFWKIYLTLLTSLVVVAALMGSLWWLFGDSPHARWGAFRIHLTDQLVTEQDNPAGAIDEVVRRLGDEIGTEISLYGRDGALIASHGAPVTDPGGAHESSARPQLFMRIDLPDGRTVLVRLKPPPGERLHGILWAMLIVAGGVGLAAFPMTARLTRQLERLRSGMARWGQGEVWARLDDGGRDEVAAVARTFNAAAERINLLLTSQKALLANASHELRSPLTRLRMAVDLWLDAPDRAGRQEIVRNLAELDQLVEEILLCSRLDHPSSTIGRLDRVDLLGLAAEEAARVGAVLEGEPVEVAGSETLLRRLVRNLLENGLQHGRAPVRITVEQRGREASLIVTDEGEGIAPAERERIFEPFYRPAGRSEADGGWGLGLSLVRQIATRHGDRSPARASRGLAAASSCGSPRSRGPSASRRGRRRGDPPPPSRPCWDKPVTPAASITEDENAMSRLSRCAALSSPRLGAREFVVLGGTLAVIAGLLASGLGDLAALGKAFGRLSDWSMTDGARAVPAADPAPMRAALDLARLAGRWRNEQTGTRVIVTAKGEVWSDLGAMEGAALPNRAAENFAFGDGTFFCAYAVTFASEEVADWTLVDHSTGTPCPSGRFKKAPAL